MKTNKYSQETIKPITYYFYEVNWQKQLNTKLIIVHGVKNSTVFFVKIFYRPTLPALKNMES